MLKMYKKKDILFSLFFMFWILFLCIQIVTYIPYFYKIHIESNQLPYLLNMSSDKVYDNFQSIVNYLSLFHRGSLYVPDIILTKESLIHFKDVKYIFMFMQLYLILFLPICVYKIKDYHKGKNNMYLKITSYFIFLLLIIVGLFVLSNFNDAFVLMHKLLFRNDFWMIDPVKDPVILLFPEAYFESLAYILLFILTVIAVVLRIIYAIKTKKVISHETN